MLNPVSAVQEILEEWDWETGFPTGRPVPRDDAHRDGIAHEAVHLWIVRHVKINPAILFQHRAAHKNNYPDCLDITVGGHVPYGFTGNKVLKEVTEEIGITPDASSLIDLGWYRYYEHTGSLIQREFQHVYILSDDRPLEEYRFNDGEVSGLYQVRVDDFKRLFTAGGSLEAAGFDGKSSIIKNVTQTDFHPQLFDHSMTSYMDVLFQAIDELKFTGKVSICMPEP